MEPKKIVIIGSVGLNGGLQMHFKELEIFLKKEGHDVFTIRVEDGKESFNTISKKSGLWVRGGNNGFWSKCLKAFDWFCAIQNAKSFRPDLYISTACGRGYASFGKAMSKKSFGLFQIVTDDYDPLDAVLLDMLKGHKAVAVQSEALAPPFESKMHFSGSLAVLPCFHQTYPSLFCAMPPEAGETLKLAYFGRLAGNKGLLLLLNVLSGLDAKINWIFDIWGSGSEESTLQDLISGNSLLSDRVSLKGRYPSGEQYNQLLIDYHGLVAPSQATEGLPLVLLEAASVGLPFLSCRIGAIGDCENDNPDILIIDVGETALQEGMPKFLNDLCAGTFNNRRLKTWFDNHHTRERYEQSWREMLLSPEDFFKNE